MEIIRDFRKINKNDTSLAGGKGASLGEMTRAGISVPPGFVILAGAFDRFLEETDLGVEIDSILHSVNHKEIHTVENASEKIQALILEAEMPQDIAAEIQKFFKNLGAKYVAVRSSATAEDSASAAWAGQLESYLNTTEKNLLENMKKCWASLFTPRAIFYRFEKGLHEQKISVAVVVQKMIESEKSGIAFSVHPVTQDRNQLIIEAGLGLGEAVVSGQITPDSYVVEKQPRRIIDKNIQTQLRGLYRVENGGNEWRDISKERRGKQVLSDKEIIDLAKLITRIEDHYDFPVDVEWAAEKEKFYIVQSRPITTLQPIDKVKDQDKPLYKYNVSRDVCLVTFEVWEDSDTNYLKDWIGVVTEKIVFERKNGVITAFESEQIFKDAIRNIKSQLNSKWIKEKIDGYHKGIKETEGLKKALLRNPTKQNLEKFYRQLTKTQGGLAIVYFVPTIEGVNKKIKNLCIKERKETENFFYGANDVFEKIIPILYPDYSKYTKVLTIKELLNKLPKKDELEKRNNYFIYSDKKFYYDLTLDDIEKKFNIKIEKFKAEDNIRVIRGKIAYKGVVNGRVAVVFGKKDLNKVKNGNILVTTMTNPDFIVAMRRATAFVTDEGGITCHAAIIAREMKKPCIIGTKIATKALKDGDLVEVDADRGVVRVLGSHRPVTTLTRTKKDTGIQIDLSKYTEVFGIKHMPYLYSEIFSLHYRKLGCALLYAGEQWTCYLPTKTIKKTLHQGLSLFKNALRLRLYEKEFRRKARQTTTYFERILNQKTLTKKDLQQAQRLAGLTFRHYILTEWFYTDLAYTKSQDNPRLQKNLVVLGQIKNWGREYLNRVYLGNSCFMAKVLQKVSRQYNIPTDDIIQYGLAEALEIFDGHSLAEEHLAERHKAYVMLAVNGRLQTWAGTAAEEFVRQAREKELDMHGTLQGVTANAGRVQGTVKVIDVGYANFDLVRKEILAMKRGQILVANTTSPEIIAACRKASAIVTNEGGLLSHAAIISRELGIPCVVGTHHATDILKNGDLVEVDANNGVVRILETQEPKLKVLTNIFSREKSLLYFCVWDESDRRGIELIGEKIKSNLFIVPPKGKKGSVWYEKEELQYLKNKNIGKFADHRNNSAWETIKDLSKKTWHFLEPYAKGEKVIGDIDDFENYYENLVNFWVCLNSFIYEAIDSDKIDEKIKEFLTEFRDKTEKYTEAMSVVLIDYVEKHLKLKGIANVVTKDEVLEVVRGKANSAKLDAIRDRLNGCFMLNGVVHPLRELGTLLRKNDLTLEEVSGDMREFSGTVAFEGVVQGTVKIIDGFNDLSKIEAGDVLVTQMTNPKYLPAIEKSAAIVTDEGGMLCHAAITARELKKPCVIGTKIATRVLKDGDLVEVDADRGVVRIL